MLKIGILGGESRKAVVRIILDEIRKGGRTAGFCASLKELGAMSVPACHFLVVSVSEDELAQDDASDIRFDVLVQTEMDKPGDDIVRNVSVIALEVLMQKAVDHIRKDGYFVFSSDTLQKINLHCEDICPVTYGLNGRTTITASSIDDTDVGSFQFCLQRSVVSITDTLIQPFERQVHAGSNACCPNSGIGDLLAAMACLMILGFKI